MKKVFGIILVSFLFFAGCKPANFVSPAIEETAIGNQPVFSATDPERQLYENFYAAARTVPDFGQTRGAILPHHLTTGYIPATFFKYLEKQKPSLVVILGPDHNFRGDGRPLTASGDWLTTFGQTHGAEELAERLKSGGFAAIDDAAINADQSISALVPFIAKSAPQAKLLPIIFDRNVPDEAIDRLAERLFVLLPADAVIIASVDFSHYLPWSTANFHDELSQVAINNFDYARLPTLDTDAPAGLRAFFRLMEKFEAKKIAFALTDNSARLTNNPSLEETTSYYAPFFAAGENQTEKIASLLNFGDMMLDRNVKKQIDAKGPDYIFEVLAGEERRFFTGIDLVSANLEGPFANWRRPTTKEIAFCFDPTLLPTLKKYNFGIFSQANNHSLDMSSAGFEESKKNLAAAGFDFYGSQYRVDAGSLLVKRVGDYNVAFIGLNDTNSPIDLEQAQKLIGESKCHPERSEGSVCADFVVINIHWGEEYKEISNSRQRFLAHKLIDAGADAIIGHHPHVIQEMEVYKNRPIFYSLGNFVFDQYFSEETQRGLAVGLIFHSSPSYQEGERGGVSAYVFPLEQEKSQVRQMNFEKGQKYLIGWIAQSRLDGRQFNDNKITIEF